MINAAVADALNRIADLMEISGDSAFRVNSYRRAARTIQSLSRDVGAIVQEGSLTKLPGVGAGLAGKIEQFVQAGRIDLLEELEVKLPPGLPDLLRIQGLGPKRLAKMYRDLGVDGVEALRDRITSGELAKLSGFGAKSVERIQEGLAFLEHSAQRTPRGIALPVAEELASALQILEGVTRVEIAGSLRRGDETIGDIDLLCECDDGPRIVQSFVASPHVKRILASGETKGSVTIGIERNRELQVDLRVVPRESFGAALQYFTGSKEHNVRLREMAVHRKWRLNEYGLFDDSRRIAGDTEESIYEQLGLPYIAPELREDRGEFSLGEPARLVSEGDLRGDLHVHTIASDGKSTIDEMAAAAEALGYAYLAITDHSRSSTIANGLSIERLLGHLDDIREANRRIGGIALLTGCECDILPDGTLDYPDDVLAKCDIVVASIHSAMRGGDVSPTDRLLAAIDNPHVNIIGHATGRLLGKRPAMGIDFARVFRAAVDANVAFEINASWQRLDLSAHHARQAIEAGVMLAINTDSHHADSLGRVGHGVVTARRAWASIDHILNARPLSELQEWIQKRKTA